MTLQEPQYILDMKANARKAVIDLKIAMGNPNHPAFQAVARRSYLAVDALANELDVSYDYALQLVMQGEN